MCRGERKAVFFFLAAGCGYHSKMGQRLLLLLYHTVGAAPCLLGGAANCGHSPSGGGVHGNTLPRRVAAPPQVLRVKGFALYTAEPESAIGRGRAA